MAYTFDYKAFPGVADGWGWPTKCSQNRLRSIPVDGSMLAEIYRDREGAIINTFNGKVTQICPRKNSLSPQSP